MSTPGPRTTALAASRGHTRRPKIRRPEAGRCWAEAKEAAEFIGVDHDDYRLCFGPTNVNIWSVGLAVEMLDGTEAIKRAEKFRLPRSAPRERVGHHWIDLARGYLLHGDHQRALVTRSAGPAYRTAADPIPPSAGSASPPSIPLTGTPLRVTDTHSHHCANRLDHRT